MKNESDIAESIVQDRISCRLASLVVAEGLANREWTPQEWAEYRKKHPGTNITPKIKKEKASDKMKSPGTGPKAEDEIAEVKGLEGINKPA